VYDAGLTSGLYDGSVSSPKIPEPELQKDEFKVAVSDEAQINIASERQQLPKTRRNVVSPPELLYPISSPEEKAKRVLRIRESLQQAKLEKSARVTTRQPTLAAVENVVDKLVIQLMSDVMMESNS